MSSGNETIEVDEEVFEDTVSILAEAEQIFRQSASYSNAGTVERHRKNLEEERNDE